MNMLMNLQVSAGREGEDLKRFYKKTLLKLKRKLPIIIIQGLKLFIPYNDDIVFLL